MHIITIQVEAPKHQYTMLTLHTSGISVVGVEPNHTGIPTWQVIPEAKRSNNISDTSFSNLMLLK